MATAIRVLYVDDESDLLNIGKMFLERSGDFTVTTALNADEGIRLLEQEKFDAIISDYQMPGMDGIQFLVAVRTRFGQIPFILFTGRGREEVVIQAINSGADFYLQKGGDPKAQFAELTHKVRQATLRNRAEDSFRKSEEKYRHLIEHSDEAIVVAQDGMLKLVNHKTIKFTGYSEQELLSMQFSVFIHPEDRAMVVERYQKRMKGEESPSRYAFRLSSKEGITQWVEISVVVIDWEGRPATLNFLTDITERKRAEDALRKSEKLYYTLSESSPDMIWLVDADGIIPYINPQAARVFGRTPADIIGKRTDLVFPKEIATHFMEEVNCVVTTKEIRKIEVLEQFPTGARWTSTRLVPITGPDNEVIQILGIATDITERKRAEDALRKSEERYKNISETTSDFVFSCIKPDGGTYSIEWIAGAVEKITGYTIDELRAMVCWRCLVHPDDTPVFDENITNLSEGASRSCILRIRTKNGTERWLTVNTTHVPGKDSSLCSHVFGGCRDITERKLAEEVLKQSEEKYRTLFERANDCILVMEAEGKDQGRIIAANTAAAKMHGYSVEELLTKNIADLDALQSRMAVPERFRRVLNGEPLKGEVIHVRKDGTEFPLEINSGLLDLGAKKYVLAIDRDITERKRVEETLREANKTLNLLSSITRHDINNQMTALQGYLAILKMKQPDLSLNDYFVKISTAAQHISSMIQFTKEYESIGVTAPVWQDCRTLVDTAVKQAQLGNVKVKNDLPAGTEVFADPLVVKVFYNLMDNAVRYGGKITTIRFSVEERKGNHLIVCEDDGNGVVSEEKEKIFVRGFGKNTGLGLALAREILSITGITIRETGEPGKGARFEMMVPKGAWRIADLK